MYVLLSVVEPYYSSSLCCSLCCLPFSGRIKGFTMKFLLKKKIIVTSNFKIKQIWTSLFFVTINSRFDMICMDDNVLPNVYKCESIESNKQYFNVSKNGIMYPRLFHRFRIMYQRHPGPLRWKRRRIYRRGRAIPRIINRWRRRLRNGNLIGTFRDINYYNFVIYKDATRDSVGTANFL